MPSLLNYLQTSRKRVSFTQEEAAFLLGITGIDRDRANKVSRDERATRTPTLETALAYELIYGKPVGELFAGVKESIARDIADRARVLRFRTALAAHPAKRRALADLAAHCSALSA